MFPVIGPGEGFTVTTTVGAPHGVLYVTVAVPGATPVTTPVELMVATDVGEQLHVPPGNVLVSVNVPVAHVATLPVIGPGRALMVTILIAWSVPHELVTE